MPLAHGAMEVHHDRGVVEYMLLLLGVHDMQQASHKAEPGDYKHAVNDM